MVDAAATTNEESALQGASETTSAKESATTGRNQDAVTVAAAEGGDAAQDSAVEGENNADATSPDANGSGEEPQQAAPLASSTTEDGGERISATEDGESLTQQQQQLDGAAPTDGEDSAATAALDGGAEAITDSQQQLVQDSEDAGRLESQLDQVNQQLQDEDQKQPLEQSNASTSGDAPGLTDDPSVVDDFQRAIDSPVPEDGKEGFQFNNGDMSKDPEQDTLAIGVSLSRQGSHPNLLAARGEDGPKDTGIQGPTLDEQAAATEAALKRQQQQQQQLQVEQEPEIDVDRDQLTAEIRAGIEERERLRLQHTSLQSRLVDYFKKKKTDDTAAEEQEKGEVDQETRYVTALAAWQNLEKEFKALRDENAVYVNELHAKLEEKKVDASEKYTEFVKYRRQSALSAANSKTGKPIPTKVCSP